MEILHIYKDYYPVVGGIENHIKTLAEGQVANGHKVTVLVCSPYYKSSEEILNGVKIIKAGRLATIASMPLSIAQPLALTRLTPDIVHIQSPFPLGELANWFIRKGKTTVITYQSDVVRQKGLLKFYGPLLRRVLCNADRIIVTSHSYMEISPWLLPVRGKCDVIPLGIDISRFVLSRHNNTAAPMLLFVGRLRYYKGLDTLLRAMISLPDVQLSVVGDGPMKENWQMLAKELGLDERVNFVGNVEDRDLPDWYKRADIFVLPSNSRAEAFGLVLLEAMASGLPCITTELGTGTSWIVQNGKTGLVVLPSNPQALAEAITSLLQDPPRRKMMGQAGRARVEQYFSSRQMILKVEALYERLI